VKHSVDLVPLGIRLEVEAGASLETALLPHGVEFPCGGAGVCRGCRVRVVAGALGVTREMDAAFTPAELAAGWRLACCARVTGPVTLEIAQWSTPILADDSRLSFEPGHGCAIAIDVGTTTLVAQIVDLAAAEVVGLETALNPQAVHGTDVMNRIEFGLTGGASALTASIRQTLGEMVSALPRRDEVRLVMLAGNTVMHHMFCGLDVAPLSHVPFQSVDGGERVFTARELWWDLPADAEVHFLPCLGGFVGSDVLAGILATGIGESGGLKALIDLGTNGEIVVANAGRMACASTAAGPAFEAGRIRMGMRAATGAIAHVSVRGGQLACRVIGDVEPRGICGSGLVDAAAAGLEMGSILPSGRLADGAREFPLVPPVSVSQGDIRELQLAKGAIAAGLRILLDRWGARVGDLRKIHLAGAFGNYVNIESARRIGLLEAETSRIVPAGNASLRGVKMALLSPSRRRGWIDGIVSRTEHVALASEAGFEDAFAASMPFPSFGDRLLNR
jgi:uncharacterized 2Fe-2S/4Fe-4S cluster protein (DUF4445 family)